MKASPLKYLFTLALIATTINYASAQRLPLYSESPIPLAKNNKGEQPAITMHRPTKQASRAAVIVCSGGAYGGRANGWEGDPAVKKLNEAGITAFLLDYRVPKAEFMEQKWEVPLMDAQRAIQFARENASKYNIDPNQIGIMGFSAGGHLAATAGTAFSNTLLSNPKNTPLRPDFMVLVYPVISFQDGLTHEGSRENLIGPELDKAKIERFSLEKQVSENTPPAYITSGLDDSLVKVENSLHFAAALRQKGVPAELFLYQKGEHGYGVHNQGAEKQWIDDCINWIKEGKFRNQKK
ncbi:alpha/beta hydrolase [Pedobacter aquatilis]|uniref:alpha/beta hydrolase n=1 Tax=Pedobacter aquatilis TaxID=351343 RepID=UPI00292DC2F7|nr:alpha/beta hydrolase [Pedobacter aquatilis]